MNKKVGEGREKKKVCMFKKVVWQQKKEKKKRSECGGREKGKEKTEGKKWKEDRNWIEQQGREVFPSSLLDG